MHRFFIACAALLLLAAAPASAADDDKTWQATLDRVVPAVVAIRVTGTRDFDTEDARSSVGTGFVIDAENGWVLTNRHMVHAGPVLAEAVFENSEEIELQPIYRDPVHDFGFYRFDPSAVKHMELAQLVLNPRAAELGMDIRVVGNDAGEKISILDGTLARVDRNAPSYGSNTYNDFNTFYLQAASNTSGGSSGSPVVNIRGEAIALNAGGKRRAASSFYLPLDRVVRAFEFVRRGEAVPRGTLQTIFRHTTFDELTRLGLTESSETAIRKHERGIIGALVVDQVVPGGPGDGTLLPGDVLLRIGGDWVTDFVAMESRVDDHVGETLLIDIERGGRALSVEIEIGDLHAITPDEFIEVGRAVLTELSYQQARNHNLPVAGVYVSIGGYSMSTGGIVEGSVLQSVDGKPVADLDEVQAILEATPDGQRVRVRAYTVDDDIHPYETVFVMDRRWFPLRRCRRDDSDGSWPCEALSDAEGKVSTEAPSGLVLPQADKPARYVASSLVRVEFDVPHPTAGVKDLNYIGVGTIVDVARGLVIVDRDTVPVRLGDMVLTFAGAVRVPGEVVFLHPSHNFGIVRYDPASIGSVPVSEVTFRDADLEAGDPVWLVGLDRRQALISVRTALEDVEPLELGVSNTPRFRDSNIEVYDTEDAESTLGGVLTDKKGRVVALWASFLDQADEDRRFRGLPTRYVLPTVTALREGREPDLRVLGAELERITLDSASDRGLPISWQTRLLAADPERRTLFEVARVHGASGAHGVVRNTDIVVAVDGEILASLDQLDQLGDEVELTVIREGVEQVLRFDTLSINGQGVDRVVAWAGLIVHEPHYEVAAQKGIEPEGVYIAWLWYGSPGARYRVRPTRRVLSVDDTPTPDLDSFLAAVRGFEDRQAVRLGLESLDGQQSVVTLKMDLRYWPTQLLEVQDGRWHRVVLEDPQR